MLNSNRQLQNKINRKMCTLAMIVVGSGIFALSGCDAGEASKSASPTQPTPHLEIQKLKVNKLSESQPTTVNIELDDASPTKSANLSIVNNNPDVLEITQHDCDNLNARHNTCDVTIVGKSIKESQELANFSISADGISSVTSEDYTIINKPAFSLSQDMPYSRTHAGIKTPVKVIFGNPIDESTVDSSTLFVTSLNGESIESGTVVFESQIATFTPSGDLKYDTPYIVHINGIKDLNGDSVIGVTESYTTQGTYYIFVSSSMTSGNIGGIGGITGADEMCNSDLSCGASLGRTTCKAMLATNESTGPNARQANPVYNWVLMPYTAYVTADSKIIGTTGIDSVFAFPLTNPIDGAPTPTWTGLDSNWEPSPNTCSDWSVGDTSKYGNIGDPSNSGNSSLYNNNQTCDTTHTLYCVQVPSKP